MILATLASVALGLFAMTIGTVQTTAAGNGQTLYVLHCSGCHGLQGSAASIGRIPALSGNVGHFMRLPQSRSLVTQAPGIMNSGLDDTDVAALMNWLVPALARDSLAEPFKPFTADEIARSRASRPADFFAARRKVAADLKKLGVELPGY
ncbi:c-type cytochrome [Mesorhizobium sp. 1B3]|uniref:c-type cytochrome n=1 Tax=Mesorhizobium sp. 1B3 TaxID=3243599 RepID=UPI003D958786